MDELDLKEIFNIFWNKKIQIFIITIIFIIIGSIYSFLLLKPDYNSFTRLVLAKTDGTSTTNSTTGSITQSDLTLNQKLISTYSELVKSKSVLRAVISNVAINDLTEEGLRKSVNVTAVEDTELLKISVNNSNPKDAAIIANEIARVFTEQVTSIYNISNIHVVDQAEVSDQPYNINHAKDLIIFAFAGIIVASIYVLMSNMLDTTIKTVEDVEKNTGLLVLAQIPEYDFDVRMKGNK